MHLDSIRFAVTMLALSTGIVGICMGLGIAIVLEEIRKTIERVGDEIKSQKEEGKR